MEQVDEHSKPSVRDYNVEILQIDWRGSDYDEIKYKHG